MDDFCKLEKRGNVFILTLIGNGEHRLNPTLIDSILAALQQIKAEVTGPSALITAAEGKFFSNGFDLKWAGTDITRQRFMSAKLRALLCELITFPMPTIAAITGHASAAGFVLAVAHDYLLMLKNRGFLYLSELDIGYKFPSRVVPLIKCKLGSPKTWRAMVMKATKLTAEMGMQVRIVESAHDSAEATVEAAVKLGEGLVQRNWNGEVYADNRTALLAEALTALRTGETVGEYGSVVKALSKL